MEIGFCFGQIQKQNLPIPNVVRSQSSRNATFEKQCPRNLSSGHYITHLAVEGVRVVRRLYEPAPEAVVVDGADVALAVAGVDHGAGVGGVGVVADPALGTAQIVL